MILQKMQEAILLAIEVCEDGGRKKSIREGQADVAHLKCPAKVQLCAVVQTGRIATQRGNVNGSGSGEVTAPTGPKRSTQVRPPSYRRGRVQLNTQKSSEYSVQAGSYKTSFITIYLTWGMVNTCRYSGTLIGLCIPQGEFPFV